MSDTTTVVVTHPCDCQPDFDVVTKKMLPRSAVVVGEGFNAASDSHEFYYEMADEDVDGFVNRMRGALFARYGMAGDVSVEENDA